MLLYHYIAFPVALAHSCIPSCTLQSCSLVSLVVIVTVSTVIFYEKQCTNQMFHAGDKSDLTGRQDPNEMLLSWTSEYYELFHYYLLYCLPPSSDNLSVVE